MQSVRKRRGTQRRCGVRRRGATAVLVAFMLIVFLAATALSVDVAYLQLTRVKLRAATDAAARAGGEALSRLQDMDAARGAARNMAKANCVAGAPLLLDDEDIVFGSAAASESGKWVFTAGKQPINAIQIEGRRTSDSLSGSVPTFFGRILGASDCDLTQEATVVRLDRDVCLVVDRSSSMKLDVEDTSPSMSPSDPRFSEPPGDNSRWAALSNAVDIFVAALATTSQIEHVALVSYASDGVWCGVENHASEINQGLTADGGQLSSALNEISARVFNGATNITAGINTGMAALSDPALARPFAAKTIILMTDGHDTTGDSALAAASQAREDGIVIHTITFGSGSDQTELCYIAELAGGKHLHASNPEALEKAFREIALAPPVLLTD